jgi:hypothetical protein
MGADESGLNVRNTQYVAQMGHVRGAAVRCGVTIVFRHHGSSGEHLAEISTFERRAYRASSFDAFIFCGRRCRSIQDDRLRPGRNYHYRRHPD